MADLRQCKGACKELKQRIPNGKFNEKDPRFIDENGKLWNGNICPKCVVERSRERMKALRASRKNA